MALPKITDMHCKENAMSKGSSTNKVVRFNDQQIEFIEEQAKKYGVDFSTYLRKAAMLWKPNKEDFPKPDWRQGDL